MPAIRFRSRHLHATIYNHVEARLTELGWVTPPINFGTGHVTFMDYQPDERMQQIQQNTVAVSLDDFDDNEEEELGARGGGLMSAPYSVFVDVYMAEQALSLAICDDIRDIFTDVTLPLINQIDQQPVPGQMIEVEAILGPSRPSQSGAEQFRRNWREMRIDTLLYFPH